MEETLIQIEEICDTPAEVLARRETPQALALKRHGRQSCGKGADF
ncbi:hypothetical protein P4576_19700 [Peribacillus frigoritolerans]|nr:hypothetical protein [Peribacillus frigoritolerans]